MGATHLKGNLDDMPQDLPHTSTVITKQYLEKMFMEASMTGRRKNDFINGEGNMLRQN